MTNKQKTFVYTLIFLLTVTGNLSLFTPAQAETWTDITLPYTITESGNYRISDAFNGSETGLSINASNVVVDGQNLPINLSYTGSSKPCGVYAEGQSNVLLKNINITSSYYGIRFVYCSNFILTDCSTTKCMGGLSTISCYDFSVNSYNSSKDVSTGIYVNSCQNFTLNSCNVYYPTSGSSNGVFLTGSSCFLATNLSISRCYMGFIATFCDAYVLRDSSINQTSNMACSVGYGQNATVTNCTFDLNTKYAIYAYFLTDFTVTQNTITNNTRAVNVGSSTMQFSNNYVATNGPYHNSMYDGVCVLDGTYNITDNIFDRNFNAIMWEPEDSTITTTCTVAGNVFQDNRYTLYIGYLLPLGSTNQKFIFSNNLVNDTAYFDSSYIPYTTLPIADGVISLNSTMQLGTRPYSNGPQIAGNFWTHPDGTGISVTGTDGDKDGFIDTTFDLIDDANVASIVDYHPYSAQFDSDNWVSFTLPAIITQPGKYRVASNWSGNTTALIVKASNVTVDGQSHLIQLTADVAAICLDQGSNIVLKNINETGADYGVYAKVGNFTVTDSLFTNNNSTAIFAFNATAFTFQHSRASNNTYGLAAMYCSNFTVNDCHIKNNTKGVVAVLSSGVTIQSSYFNNNTEALTAQNCTGLQLDSSIFVENEGAVNATFTELKANNISASSNVDYGIRLTYSNLTAYNSECQNNSIGLYSVNSNFAATHSLISNNGVAGILSGYGNTTLNDCALENNTMYGILSLMGNNTQIDSCSVKNNEYGIAALGTQEFQLTNSLIFNNSFAGVVDELSNNTRITSNDFTQNGLDIENEGYGGGALLQIGTNCVVSDNLFKNNYDGLLIGSFGINDPTTQIYRYNTFENNTYTFDFNYNDAFNSTSDVVYFYNNYVNDIAYVNPISFTSEGQVTPAANVLHLNTTLQTGKRVTLDGGRMIGGNYWAHPNGTGPSQTGADADRDGFLDAPFDLFGNQTVLDYLPYSSSFQEKIVELTISPDATSVKAGQTINYTATATDKYGNKWNVTADYTLNGNPFSGGLSIIYPGAYSVQASYDGQTVDAILYVTPAEVDRYVVITPASVTADSPFAIRIVAVDAYNNIVTDFSGTVTLSCSNGAVNPSVSGAFSYGTWIGNVTVTDAESFTITVSDGSGNTGTSSVVTATQESTEPTPTPTPTQSPTTQPTANPTDSTGTADSYWWAWYAVPTIVLLVLVATGVYLVKHPKKPLTQ